MIDGVVKSSERKSLCGQRRLGSVFVVKSIVVIASLQIIRSFA